MKTLRLLSLLAVACGFMYAQSAAPEGYYDSLEGYKGIQLRKQAKSIVKSHKAISYGDATWKAFLESDTRVVNGQRCWWDMYSSDDVAATSAGNHPGMNIEHAMANSWWGGTKNDAYKDLFNLNPSNINANSRKSNYPYVELADVKWTNGVTSVGTPKAGLGGGCVNGFEPLDEYKGDFARGVFYMFTVYDDITWKAASSDTRSGVGRMYTPGTADLLQPWAVEMLLRWSVQDPVSQKEIDRNNAIYKSQGNRNPYIDLPGLEHYVWGSHKDDAFSLSDIDIPEVPDPVDPVDPVDPDDPDNPDPVTPAEGGNWYQVMERQAFNSEDSYVIVADASGCFMSYEAGSTGKYLAKGDDATMLVGDDNIRYVKDVPDNTAVIMLEMADGPAVNGGLLCRMKVYDARYDTFKGYLVSSETKNCCLSTSPTDAYVTLSVADGLTTVDFGTSGKLLYNSSSPRFTTYTSSGDWADSLMMLRLHKDTSTIISPAEIADDSTVTVFNLQGVKMAKGERSVIDSLPRGLYVVVSGGKCEKIIK